MCTEKKTFLKFLKLSIANHLVPNIMAQNGTRTRRALFASQVKYDGKAFSVWKDRKFPL